MTPAQAETQARRRYNAVSQTTFFAQDELFKYMYEGEMILAREGIVIEALDQTTSTVASTRGYAFPTNFISIKRLEYNGNKLQYVTFQEDDRLTLSNSATTTTGTPQYYSVWNKTVYLRPVPDDAQTLSFYGYKEPTLLTTASTAFTVPSDFHTDLIDYCVMLMALKDENIKMATFYEARWEKALERAKMWNRRSKRGDRFQIVKDAETLAQTIIGDV